MERYARFIKKNEKLYFHRLAAMVSSAVAAAPRRRNPALRALLELG
jgi:hypothetical protein